MPRPCAYDAEVNFAHQLARFVPLHLTLFVLVATTRLVAQDPVADTLAKLSLPQKAGQLFMSWSLSRPEGNNHEQMLRWVEEVGLGGVILSLGTVADAASLIPKWNGDRDHTHSAGPRSRTRERTESRRSAPL